MKILLMSDTHGHGTNTKKLLERYKNEADIVCHSGDGAGDLLKLEREYPMLRMEAVPGNVDYSILMDTEIILNLQSEGFEKPIRILLVHGHHFGVKSGLDRLISYAKRLGVDACFFGHTHKPVCENVDGLFIMNPGSLKYPDGERFTCTYGLVQITPDGEISGEHFDIES